MSGKPHKSYPQERIVIRGNLHSSLTEAAERRNMPLEQLVHEVMEVWLAEQRRALREDEVEDWLRVARSERSGNLQLRRRERSPRPNGYTMKGAAC